jgi:hypothetical protein
MDKKLAIVIQSCDKYNEAWQPFYELFFKYWVNCSYKIYHISESLNPQTKDVFFIPTGFYEWSKRLKIALNQLNEKYILLLLEDYFLIKEANESLIEKYLKILEDENAAFIRIFPVPGPNTPYKNFTEIGAVIPNSEYSLSTQATIWNRADLINFIDENENIWDFELMGSNRTIEFNKPMLCVNEQKGIKLHEEGDYAYTYLCTAIFKGKWMKEAQQFALKEKLLLKTNIIKLETRFDFFYRKNYQKMPLFFKHFLDYIKSRVC